MKVFDLDEMAAFPYDERDKNVFYKAPHFKVRIIDLPAGGAIPHCEMAEHVIFCVLSGEARATVGPETLTLRERQCLITEPATIAMRTDTGVRMLGVQIQAPPADG